MNHSMKFHEDGTFKIVQFTDIHWGNGEEADQQTRLLMEQMIAAEEPDLVVFTGDIIGAGGCRKPLQSVRDAVAIIEESRTPWAAVFGNHDTEAKITREQMMAVMKEHDYCLADDGPEEITGTGNYVLKISDENENLAAALYFFDSGNQSPLSSVGGYDWVRRDQIEWYTNQSSLLKAQMPTGNLPALAFFHIPLPEYEEVWRYETCFGNKHETVCCPHVNTGLFSAMVESGDVAGTFVGHDHVNDYWGSRYGIRLCYGRATGYNTYGKEGFLRGARIIRMKKGSRDFDTWLRLADGTVIDQQQEHQPEGREEVRL